MSQMQQLRDAISSNTVAPVEIDWMLAKRPLVFSWDQLVTDYKESKANEIKAAFEQATADFASSPESKQEERKFEQFLACLSWPGVGTRWRPFLQYLISRPVGAFPSSPLEAFTGFANHLGRVSSYRSLALSSDAYQRIVSEDSIWPSGRLKTDADTLLSVVNRHGIAKVAYARLYISQMRRLIGPFDPSLSLHDDAETSVCIASGYVDYENGMKIYTMEMSVPLIEVLGMRVCDVAPHQHRWFNFRGIEFDSQDERTERYALFEIPFYSARLQALRTFDSDEAVTSFLRPFKQLQDQKKLESGEE
eukprot:TRINITY_DN3522_c0_g1_i3.p1 TRINITY_DN3522_c0_g1~~TRINITY_DN3522_c0_g1_i3.p1  ORF type:complete len:306 (-),score=45.02 TRINITY_DN3522_c0_g1_i3:233-1150(-)